MKPTATRANSRPKPNVVCSACRLGGRPAGVAQERDLLRDEARRRHAEQKEAQVQHPKRGLARRLLECEAEGPAGGGQFARRDVGRGRLAQAVGNDGPAHEQYEERNREHGVAPTVGRDDRADHQHRQKRAADADAGVRAAQRQAELAIEPGRDGLQIAERPEAQAGYGHDRPEQVVDVDVRRREVDGRQAQREQRNRRQHDAPRAEPVDEHALQRRHHHDHVGDERECERDV